MVSASTEKVASPFCASTEKVVSPSQHLFFPTNETSSDDHTAGGDEV